MSGATLPSQLVLPGIRCPARIGQSEEEAAHPQDVVIALALTFDGLASAAVTDNLADTVDYAQLTEMVVAVSASRRFHLLESLAQAVREAVLLAVGAGVHLWVEVAKATSPISILSPSASFAVGSPPQLSILAHWQAGAPPRRSHASRPSFVGILNVTEDSFSDGGRFVDAGAAIAHGERLLSEGADWLDIGAESSNPSGRAVADDVQIARLTPLLKHFAKQRVRISIDTHRPAVMRAALELGAEMVNDITALGDPEAVRLLATLATPVVVMFVRSRGPRASTAERSSAGIGDEAVAYFRARISSLEAAGISRERLIIDPGMGYFLGGNPGPSLSMLKDLRELIGLGRPLYVSTSRKSFIGAITGRCATEDRAFGTVASELWALSHGADYLRTHDVRAIRDAWTLWQAIEAAP